MLRSIFNHYTMQAHQRATINNDMLSEHRDACVEAINNFRREYGLLPIAVCSRIADYKALGTKLRLGSAVEVQPLTRLLPHNWKPLDVPLHA